MDEGSFAPRVPRNFDDTNLTRECLQEQDHCACVHALVKLLYCLLRNSYYFIYRLSVIWRGLVENQKKHTKPKSAQRGPIARFGLRGGLLRGG